MNLLFKAFVTIGTIFFISIMTIILIHNKNSSTKSLSLTPKEYNSLKEKNWTFANTKEFGKLLIRTSSEGEYIRCKSAKK